MTIQGLKDYRCPHCKSDRCGNDANAGWDVVTQQSVLLGEFDAQWCNDCGDVTLEEYEITDAQEIARIEAARAALAVEAAAPLLLAAADSVLMTLGDLSAEWAKGSVPTAIEQLTAAIAAARPERRVGMQGRAQPLI
jgi:hypothetical protein